MLAITQVKKGQTAVMTWLAPATDFNGTAAGLPALAEAHLQLYRSLVHQQAVPAFTLELCRLRLAQLHGTTAQWLPPLAAVEEDSAGALRQWPAHASFSDTDRACLDFAEVYAIDPGALSDEQADRVKVCVGERGLVVLIEALGVLDGALRLGLLWELDGEKA